MEQLQDCIAIAIVASAFPIAWLALLGVAKLLELVGGLIYNALERLGL